jgi:hypothetical protein
MQPPGLIWQLLSGHLGPQQPGGRFAGLLEARRRGLAAVSPLRQGAALRLAGDGGRA